MRYIDVAKKITREITQQYPNLNVYYDCYDNDEEIFILIDDAKIFDTLSYRKMIRQLRNSSEYKVFFSCIYSNDELTKNAVNLTEENKKESVKIFTYKEKLDTFGTYIKFVQLGDKVADKQIVPNGLLKPFMGFGSLPLSMNIDKQIVPNGGFIGFPKGDNLCQNIKTAGKTSQQASIAA